MKVRDLGEFGLIAQLAGVLDRASGAAGAQADAGVRLLLGIGDDAAVYEAGGALELATTDTLVDGVHFLSQQVDWTDLGWKALAVNLSDIAAMGGVPGIALVTLGLPAGQEVEPLNALYRGMAEAAQAFGAHIAGGDIVRSPVLFITVSLSGTAAGAFPDGVLRRAAARPGDQVAVTGELGSSAAGLRTFLADTHLPAAVVAALRRAHLRPQPRVAAGQALVRAGIRCAMDVSDGLLADLGKLCTASGVAARVTQDRVPVSPLVREYFPEDWRRLALSGGEDYELLFTGPADLVAGLQQVLAVPVTVIGEVEAGEAGQVTLVDGAGQPVPGVGGGWDHLAEHTP